MSQRKKPGIVNTISRTCAMFAILGLATICLALLVNVGIIGMSIMSPPKPEVKRIIVTGLDAESIRLSVEVDFPESVLADVLHLKMDAGSEVQLSLETASKRTHKLASVAISDPIDINLSSSQKTSLALNEIKLKFHPQDSSDLISEVLDLKSGQLVLPEKLKVHVRTRVVSNTLLIPFGTYIDMPYDIPFSSLMGTKPKKPSKPKPISENSKKSDKVTKEAEAEKPKRKERKAPAGRKGDLTEETQNILDNFVPKKIQLSSTSDEFSIEMYQSIPLEAIPDQLAIDVPKMKFSIAYKDLSKKEPVPHAAVSIEIDAFAIGSLKALQDMKVEVPKSGMVEIKVKFSVTKHAYELAKLARDEQLDDVELSIGVDEGFILGRLGKGDFFEESFLYWLSKIRLHGTLAQFKNFAEKMSKSQHGNSAVALSKPVDQSPAPPTIGAFPEKDVNFILKTIFDNIKVKLVRVHTESGKSTVEARIRILRKRIINDLGLPAGLLTGQIPGISFTVSKAGRDKEEFKDLLGFRFESNPISRNNRRMDLRFQLSVFHFLAMKPIEGDLDAMKKAIAEVKDIERLRVRFEGENVLSKILAVANCDVYLTPELKPDRVQLLDGGRSISLKPVEKPVVEGEVKKEASPVITTAAIEKIKIFAQNQLQAAFVVKNEVDAAVIAAKFSVPQPATTSPIKLFSSWGAFHFDVLLNERSLLAFVIQHGHLVVGPSGLADGVIKFNLRIPSQDKNLDSLKRLVRAFTDQEAVIDADDKLVLRVRFGDGKHAQGVEQGFFLQLLKDIKDGKLVEPVPELKSSSKDKPAAENNEQAEHVDAEHKEQAKNVQTSVEAPVKEPSFLTDLANSVLQLVSFQTPTLFFHINIPDKNYCTHAELNNDFNLKIDVSVALPVIEARLCAKEPGKDRMSCLLRAGLSRPTILTSTIVDGKICFANFIVLAPDESLIGFKAITAITKYKFDSNEAPVHPSAESLPNIIRFGEALAARVPQILTLSAWEDATAINKVIGEVGSAALAISLEKKSETESSSSVEKQPETKSSSSLDKKSETESSNNSNEPTTGPFKKLTVVKNEKEPVALDFVIKSLDRHSLELFFSFSLPSFVLDNLATAMDQLNLYRWTVIRWGLMDYKVYIPNVFEANFAMSPGELDLKPDGPVLAGEQVKIAVDFSLKVNERISFGSSALHQILSFFKSFALTPPSQRKNKFPAEFFDYLQNEVLSYEMKTRGAHGFQDKSIFAVNGQFPLRSIFEIADAILNRDAVKSAHPVAEMERSSPEQAPEQEKKANPFERLLVSLTTLPSNERLEPRLNVPCLIPALCRNRGQLQVNGENQDEINLYIEIKNALQPATKLASDEIGKILQALHFSKYPSHFRMTVKCLTQLHTTFMINGVGLASVGLSPFEFSRIVEISYPTEAVESSGAIAQSSQLAVAPVDPKTVQAKPAEEEDSLALKLSFSLAETIGKFSESLNTVRIAYLQSVFAVPPALFEAVDGKAEDPKRVRLVNPAFMLGFGNDVLLAHDKSSLLASIISGLIQEIRVPGINFADPKANDEKEKPSSKKVVKAEPEKPSGMSVKRISPLPNASTIANLIACLTTSFRCDNEISAEFNVSLPFPEDFLLSFNLPSWTRISLYHVDLPFVVITLTPQLRSSNRLIIGKGNVEIYAKVQLNFFGVGAHSTDPNLYTKILSNLRDVSTKDKAAEMLQTRLRVEMGNEVDFEAELNLPLYKLKHLVYKYLKLAGKRDYDDIISLESPPKADDLLATYAYRKTEGLSQLQTECIRGEAAEPDSTERKYRLFSLDLQNTALFFEEGKDAVEADVETNVYLQLMNEESLPVCGLPSKIKNLKLVLSRKAAKQPDIKLIGLFNCPAPAETEESTFETEFIPHASLFKASIRLTNSGIYKVKLLYGESFGNSEEIHSLSVYVHQ